jgi:hypothetical protein
MNAQRKITYRGYEIRHPVTESLMRVTRYDEGGITRSQRAIEMAVNAAIFVASVFVSAWLSPGFGILWVLLCALVLLFAGEKLAFKFFPRVPPSKTVSFESTVIPSDLIARYERAEAEFQSVMEEIQRLEIGASDSK